MRWKIWQKELKKLGINSKRELFEIDKGIKAGYYILTKYYKQTGSVEKALNRYVGAKNGYARNVLSTYAELILLSKNCFGNVCVKENLYGH